MDRHLIDNAFDIAEEEVEKDESGRTLLRERTMIRSSHGENHLTQITNDLTAVNHLLLIEKLVPRLLQDDKDLFAVDALRGQPVLKGTDRYLSAYLYQCIRQSDEILAEHFPNHCYHPWVSLYLQKKESLAIHLRRAVMETHHPRCSDVEIIEKEQGFNVPIYLILSGTIHHHIGLGAREVCDSLNAFVRDIRISARSADFRQRLRSHRYAIEKNKRSLECYIDNLFEQHSRILVIRVDFGYGKDVSLEPSKTAHTTSEDVRRHRDRLLKNIPSNSLFSGLVGYIWKLEYGLEKGYHYHWIFFFDGRTRCRDVWLGQKIGEYWQKIVGETAVYWNCNANKNSYRRLGIGMISRGDDELRKNLIEAAEYLTKPDLHLRLVDATAGRTFGRGEIRKTARTAVTSVDEGDRTIGIQ